MDTKKIYSYRWVILILVWMMLFMHSLMLQSIPPIMTTLADDVGLTYTQLGTLMGIGTLSSLVLAIPGGIWVDRYGSRRVILAALALYVIGISTLALSGAYTTMLIGRFISGSGAALLFVVAPMSVSEWFKGREIGLAMGVFNIAVPVGVFFAFNVFGMIVESHSWQIVIWISDIAALLMLLATLVWFKEKPPVDFGKQTLPDSAQTPRKTIWELLNDTRVSTWILSLVFFLYSASVFQVMTIGPAHFEQTLIGFDRTDLVASMSMAASIFLSPLIGWLIDFTKRKDLLSYAGLAGCALFMVLTPLSDMNPYVMMLLLGVFIAMLLPCYYAYPVDIVQPQQMGFAFGLFSATFGVGIFSGSFIVGYLRDVMGNFTGAFFFMALACLIMIWPVYLVERGRNKIREEKA
jgi:MFS family permease